MRGLHHCKHLFFHEATFLGLLGENPFCLAPGMFTVMLSFSFELFVCGEAGRNGTIYAAEERAHALSEAGPGLKNRGIWGMRTSSPSGIGAIVRLVP